MATSEPVYFTDAAGVCYRVLDARMRNMRRSIATQAGLFIIVLALTDSSDAVTRPSLPPRGGAPVDHPVLALLFTVLAIGSVVACVRAAVAANPRVPAGATRGYRTRPVWTPKMTYTILAAILCYAAILAL
jgi:hypothetical protein